MDLDIGWQWGGSGVAAGWQRGGSRVSTGGHILNIARNIKTTQALTLYYHFSIYITFLFA